MAGCESFDGTERAPFRIVEETAEFVFESGRLFDFIVAPPFFSTLSLQIDNMPVATGNVTLDVRANAPLANSSNWVSIQVSNAENLVLAELFRGEFEGTDCDPVANHLSIVFNPIQWRFFYDKLVDWFGTFTETTKTMVLAVRPAGMTDPDACGGTWIELSIRFQFTISSAVETLDLKLWSEDKCQNVVYGMGLRPATGEHDNLPPQGDFSPVAGRYEMISLHENRLRISQAAGDTEVCEFSYATPVSDPRGRLVGILCTEQEQGVRIGGLWNHYAHPFIRNDNAPWVDGDNLGRVVKPGYGGFIAGIEGPWWYELLIHSEAMVCIPPAIEPP